MAGVRVPLYVVCAMASTDFEIRKGVNLTNLGGPLAIFSDEGAARAWSDACETLTGVTCIDAYLTLGSPTEGR